MRRFHSGGVFKQSHSDGGGGNSGGTSFSICRALRLPKRGSGGSNKRLKHKSKSDNCLNRTGVSPCSLSAIDCWPKKAAAANSNSSNNNNLMFRLSQHDLRLVRVASIYYL